MTLPLDGTPPVPRSAISRREAPACRATGRRSSISPPAARSACDPWSTARTRSSRPSPNRSPTVSWINDTQLALSTGGGRGETMRHEQTPEYSGAKIIYTVTERCPARRPTLGAADRRRHAEARTARLEAAAADAAAIAGSTRRTSSSIARRPTSSGAASLSSTRRRASRRLVHEDVKTTFWSMTGDARRAARRRHRTASGSRS